MDVIRDLNPISLGFDEDAVRNPPPGKPSMRHGYLGEGSCVPWIDDLTIRSGGADAGFGVKGHTLLLGIVFDRLIAAGMTLKASKAHLLRDKLEVLGFLVTREGLRPHPDKVKAIRETMGEKLTSKKQVLRWLGMVNFYRRFIHRIGHTLEPMYRLLKKDMPDSWEHHDPSDPAYPWNAKC